MVNAAFWKGRRVLVTGHTGFKGSWLTLWLRSLGAHVTGFSLPPPTEPAMYELAQVGEGILSTIGDLRARDDVAKAMRAAAPEIVLHLAAQPLVRESYRSPLATYHVNVIGTAHVLEAARESPTVKSIVNVTTDKCYENREWTWGYRENDGLGGHDPYSSSKACSELVTSAYRASFFHDGGPALASARAGNVIGGGDWAADRLVPDVLRAFQSRKPVRLRHPEATRPWQHVLEPVHGYLLLAEKLFEEGQPWAEAWNFGPDDTDVWSVGAVVAALAEAWGEEAAWEVDGARHPHEAGILKLDTSKARCRLKWRPSWRLSEALSRTVEWHRAWIAGKDMRAVTIEQIRKYEAAGEQTND